MDIVEFDLCSSKSMSNSIFCLDSKVKTEQGWEWIVTREDRVAYLRVSPLGLD